MSSYTPHPPEADPKLQANPYYWLYKITREALDDENHPLRDMGHIWNRWAYEGLSEEEKEELAQVIRIKRDIYPILFYNDKQKIIHYIQDIEGQINYQLPSLNENIIFLETTWQEKISFERFIFRQNTFFLQTKFIQKANFSFVIFIKEINFASTIFTKYANFIQTTFMDNAYFKIITFIENVDFMGIKFIKDVYFSSTKFTENVSFWKAKFIQKISFNGATFIKNIDFRFIEFEQNIHFESTVFKENVDFSNTIFKQNAYFGHAIFSGNIIRFIKCKFLKPSNTDTSFSFAHAVFEKEVNFSESEFQHLPNMTGTDFRCGINLDKVKFPPNIKEHCHSEAKPKNPPHLGRSFTSPKGSFRMTFSMCYQRLKSFFISDTLKEKILGGLPTFKDAEITWHALQTEMEKAGYHEKAVEYFGYELDAKRFNTNINCFFRHFVLRAYKCFSDYGQGIGRPVTWWFVFIGLFMGIYCYHLEIIPKKCSDISIPLQLSLKGAVPFISDLTTYYDRMFTDPVAPEACTQTSQYKDKENVVVNQVFACDTVKLPQTTLSENSIKEPIPFNNTLELEYFPLLHGLHTVLSLILIFLFGLGVRHRLRLK